MPTDPRKRQKQLQRKAAKRKEKRHQIIRQQSIGIAERLAAAARYPVLHCWIPDSIEIRGIGSVMLSRACPNGDVAMAVFLVDAYCLGVKDAFGRIVTRTQYDDLVAKNSRGDMASYLAPAAEGRKLIEGAVAYARNLGFEPHPDCAKAMALFGNIDPADSDATFEFGKDGKPYFFPGPNDTPEKCRRAMATLTSKVGPGGFNFTMAMSESDMRMLVPDAVGAGGMPAVGEWDTADDEEGDEGDEQR